MFRRISVTRQFLVSLTSIVFSYYGSQWDLTSIDMTSNNDNEICHHLPTLISFQMTFFFKKGEILKNCASHYFPCTYCTLNRACDFQASKRTQKHHGPIWPRFQDKLYLCVCVCVCVCVKNLPKLKSLFTDNLCLKWAVQVNQNCIYLFIYLTL